MSQWNAQQWVGLLALSFAVFMVSLDITVVTVALPAIQRDFQLDFASVQWVVNAYTLSYGSLLVAAGTLADRHGRRRMFLLGLVVFAAASAACGLAPGGQWLILARIVQGAGGAALASCSIALVAAVFHGRDRQVAYAVWATAVGFGLALGPSLGGQVVTRLDWHWVFLFNVPVTAAIVLMAMRTLPDPVDAGAGRFDFYGFACFAPALVLLIYALIQGGAIGWNSAARLLALAALLLAAFVVIEQKRRHPLFDVRLFAVPTFIGVSIVSIAASVGYWSLFIYLPLYLDRVLRLDAGAMGIVMLPFTLPMLLVPPFGAGLSRLVAPQTQFALGLGLIAAGDFYLAAGMGTHAALASPMLLAGIGAGLINAQITHVAVGVVSPERSGMASGMSATMRQVGFAIGVAGLGAILGFASRAALLESVAAHPGLSAIDAAAAAQAVDGGLGAQFAAGLPVPLQRDFLDLAAHSFSAGFHTALLVAGGVSLTAAVLAFVLVRQRDMHALAPLRRT